MKSLIAKMACRPVIANLIVFLLIIGGYLAFTVTTKEVFPDFSDDSVTVSVSHPGAGAAEIEKSILIPIENSLAGISGIDEINSEASEGLGKVNLKLSKSEDEFIVYQEIKNMVGSLTSLPSEADKPLVSLSRHKAEVVQMIIYGDVPRVELKRYANQIYDYLSDNDNLGAIEIKGLADSAIYIEVPQQTLSKHELGIRDIARKVRAWSLNTPGAIVRSKNSDILLQVNEGRDAASGYGDIPVFYSKQGSSLPLKNIATINERLVDDNNYANFNGKHAAIISVFRADDQTPVGVSDEVNRQLQNIRNILPKQIGVKLLDDRSKVFSQRAELLKNNGLIGFLLVVILLGLFMGLKFAFWVGVSIPMVFFGTFMFFPSFDLSINLITMFAFIISLGIVVDDAIIVGENIFSYRERGYEPLDAAVAGAAEVASPVTYSVLTNIVAFMPLFFVPGVMGKIFVYIPAVVVIIFVISLLESLFVLPAHLASIKKDSSQHGLQHKFKTLILPQVRQQYARALQQALNYRYMVLAAVFSIFIMIIGFAASGRMGMVLFPDIESDIATATVSLSPGASMSVIADTADRLHQSAEEVIAEIPEPKITSGVLVTVTGNKVKAKIYLVDGTLRDTSTSDVIMAWKRALSKKALPGAISFSVNEKGPASDSDLTIELKHTDTHELRRAAVWLGERLAAYEALSDIDDGVSRGREEWNFTLNKNGIGLGFNAEDIASQIRSAFYGYKVLEQSRGRDDIDVYVRLPEAERDTNYEINNFILRTPKNAEVLLKDVVTIDKETTNNNISRRNGFRVVTLTAAVEPKSETINIQKSLEQNYLPEMKGRFPGVSYSFEGKQADMLASIHYLLLGFIFAIAVMYSLLVILFDSFTKPILIFFIVPFSFIGVALGNYILGYPLSILSLFGMVALTGIVINDGLVLLKFIEDNMQKSKDMASAVNGAAVRRLFPAFLTSITTFVGLLPMILERSMQAKFLIPMAVALGFGSMVALFLTLFVLPVLYAILADIKKKLVV